MNQSFDADLIYKDKPNTNHILEKLMDKELIYRKAHVADRRSYQIYLTERGKTLKTELVPIAEKLLEEATKGISIEKIDELKTYMNQIFKNLL